jgi:hypothetical protein
MLTREQRMKAVPGLIDLGDDTSLRDHQPAFAEKLR